MNKSIICLIVVVFALLVVADQSWAMGKRGGGSGSRGKFHNSNYQGSTSEGSSSVDYDDENNSNENNEGGSGNSDQNNSVVSQPQGFYDEQSFSDDEFPASTTVPEPATLSLVGMGLASFLLKRRKQ